MKRHHTQRSLSPSLKLDDEEDSYEPYVPVAERRRQKLAKLYVEKRQQNDQDDHEDVQKEEELRKEKARMERTLLVEAQEVHSKKAIEGMFIYARVKPLCLFTSYQISKKPRVRKLRRLMLKFSKPSKAEES